MQVFLVLQLKHSATNDCSTKLQTIIAMSKQVVPGFLDLSSNKFLTFEKYYFDC